VVALGAIGQRLLSIKKAMVLPRGLRALMLVTDLGFLVYWATTCLRALPDAWLYADHDNPVLVAWNASFLPIDLLVSASGLGALVLARRGAAHGRAFAVVSLTLTAASGLMAVSFWTVRGDFDPTWWIPNLFLLLYPLFFIPKLVHWPPVSDVHQT
jgi:hypothetical protein